MRFFRRLAFWILVGILVSLAAAPALGARGGRSTGAPGVPLYVIIEVAWDGVSPTGSWTVWGPKWDPEVGTGLIVVSSDDLPMDYTFTFHGKTVHFDETMVPGVRATPQSSHVVLFDNDGDGTYTGSLSASHYFPWKAELDGTWAILYFDRIDYEITFDENGQVTSFHYLQYEHKKLE